MNKLIPKGKAILSKPYTRRLTPDESGGYVVSVLEFPGCIAEGDTAEQALKNFEEAAESWIDVSLSHGREIREPIDFDGYSGKLALRLPRSLHRQIAELADIEGASINQLLVSAISFYVGETSCGNAFDRELTKFRELAEILFPAIHHMTFQTVLMENLFNKRESRSVIESSKLKGSLSDIPHRHELKLINYNS